MIRVGIFVSLIAFLTCSAAANEKVELVSLFGEAEQLVKAASLGAPSYLAEAALPLNAAPPLTVAPGSEERAQNTEECTVGLNDIRSDLDELSVAIAATKASLVSIDEAYKTASIAVPRGTITQCTVALASPLDALVMDIAAIEFGPLRTSAQKLTGCAVQHEAEITRQNDAYTQDPDSLSSSKALLLAAKLKLVSEVSAGTLELSHEVERLDSKRSRMAEAIAETRSFCVDDF